MRVMIAGGGTGGHLYPALAIADKIKEREPGSEFLFLGSPYKDVIECRVVPQAGYKIRIVPCRWVDRAEGPLMNFIGLFLTAGMTAAGIVKSLWLMKRFKPDVVIGTGGFVCPPMLVASHLAKIKSYLQEQNAIPGMTNKLLSRYAERVFLGFESAAEHFADPGKTVYSGNPVRSIFFGLHTDEAKAAAREKLGIPKDDFVLTAFGGSLGSPKINDLCFDYIAGAAGKPGRTTILGTGRKHFADCEARLKEAGLWDEKKVRVSPFIVDMMDVITAADLLICRAGALSLAETTVCGKPSILIPLPEAMDNHQYYNAKSIADKGGAILIEEKDIDSAMLCRQIEELAEDPAKLRKMAEASYACAPLDAADIIYETMKKDLETR
ncbi:MAG: undecaprenyldiphospho-muramoylpentapeptide beta-N-acetylglucosaminyltransferase [Eubacterium sp.]|nr:undecaprenyldiphospho-muramoylpentapeptide beta-N-acetylglucosaminyltransferase [Eubacterium sp.]